MDEFLNGLTKKEMKSILRKLAIMDFKFYHLILSFIIQANNEKNRSYRRLLKQNP